MWKSPIGFGVCASCGEVFATLERGRCRKCRSPEREAERSLVRERIRDAIRGQCEICGNVALLDADNWCDECNVVRDEHCEIRGALTGCTCIDRYRPVETGTQNSSPADAQDSEADRAALWNRARRGRVSGKPCPTGRRKLIKEKNHADRSVIGERLSSEYL